MGERRGHPVVAGFIVVVTLFGVLVGSVLAAFGVASSGGSDPELGPVYKFLAVMGLVAGLVGGLWLARRVAIGYWGPGSRPRVGKGRSQEGNSPSPTEGGP